MNSQYLSAPNGKQSPVFICGLPRSGTSLMRSVIGSHPNIAMAHRDFQWITRVHPRYPGELSERRWKKLIDELFGLKQTTELGLNLESLRRQVEQTPGNPLKLTGLLMSAYADRMGRPRWAVKVPLLELHARRLLDHYSGARIIHVVRDPRDICSSILRRGLYGPVRRWIMDSVAWMTMNWKQSVRIAARIEAQDPKRYRTVRYEDFVGAPEETLKILCKFIAEEFDPAMLRMSDFPEFRDHGGNSSFAPVTGISSVPIGRFREFMRPSKIRTCELVAGRELTHIGYEPSHVRLGMVERLRLVLLESPMALVRIVLRAGLQVARLILPTIFGRRPLPDLGAILPPARPDLAGSSTHTLK